VSSRSHSTFKHISHDRRLSNSTHPHCRSPAGPRAVSPARLRLVLYGRSASLCHNLPRYLFPILALFLLAPISSLCLTHLPLSLWQVRQNPTSSYPHALQSDKEPRGVSTDSRRPGMLQIGSSSCWINLFHKQAGKATAKNQLAASSGPAGTAAAAALHGFQWPVCIVPPTLQLKVVVQCPLPRLPPHSGSSGQPVLRGTSASTHEQTCGRRPGALCPAARAADYPGRRAACAVAMQTPAGAMRRASRMLPNIDRGKWGQHLYQIRSGWQSRASAQTAIRWSPRCVDSASRFSASASWTTTVPSDPGRTSHSRRRRPRVPWPARQPLPLRPRPPLATHVHILSLSGRFDVKNGRSHI
jgi:hypothetical protein